MKTVILAGGLGTRISDESSLRPKPMIEIGGLPILWHIMKHYSFYGFQEFIICCGYKGHVIKEFFADYYMHGSDITFNFTDANQMIVHSNAVDPWKVTLVDTGLQTQTGGRISRIQKYVGDEPFFMTYGDGVSDIDLISLLKQHQRSGKTVTLTAVQPEPRFGILDIEAEGETVLGFFEKPRVDDVWINAGYMVMNSDVFGYLRDDESCILETLPLQKMSADRTLGAYRHNGFWQCMDTPRDRSLLERLWTAGKAPWAGWQK